MATTARKPPWQRLRDARRKLGLNQSDLAATRHMSKNAIHRRELPPEHPDHVPMSEGECDIWIGHAKELVRERAAELTPAEVLE